MPISLKVRINRQIMREKAVYILNKVLTTLTTVTTKSLETLVFIGVSDFNSLFRQARFCLQHALTTVTTFFSVTTLF